ncbi:MAG: precorrin-6y C5,15-methyltransferase (decarboxylating) subunit CbiE [Oscillospiraceae bacterium]|nr:precorrin-6y C5,15-methyltransferase (decarboxylating) subunit CbiE [Oscillospiraceae bacterium]
MEITLIGMGMGNPDTLTAGAWTALEKADQIIGAKRLLEALPDSVKADRLAAIAPAQILQLIEQAQGRPVCVIFSGDTGFYSGATQLTPLLEEKGYKIRVLCGISTIQYLAAQLHRPWQDVHLVSAHGMECDVVGQVLCREETFFLTGGKVTPETILQRLCAAGLDDVQVTVGEQLSYPAEKITSGTAGQLQGQTFAPLSAVWVRREPVPPLPLGGALADESFLRGETPMTKQEVRAVVLAKLAVLPGETVYDIGAGTGSVSVELARLSPLVRVIAVENDPAALELIRCNRERFGVYNLSVVPGTAPDVLAAGSLPAPDAVFIGGSKGRMKRILQTVAGKNPRVRIVATAIALETLQEVLDGCRETGLDQVQVTQISVSRTRSTGRLHLLMAQNPVFLIQALHPAL